MRRRLSYPQSQTYNPARPPDWRWRRACHIVESGMYASSKRDDEMTCRAVRFLRASRRCRSDRGYRNLAKREPGIFLALRLARESTLEVQSRVLAEESDRTIARKIGLPERAVGAYTGLFFSVRDRLHAKLYIAFEVAGLHPAEAPSDRGLMLASCYHHGPHAVDTWLDHFAHVGKNHDLNTELGRQRASIELFIAVNQLRVTKDNHLIFLKRFDLIDEMALKSGKARSIPAAFSENTSQFLTEMRWAEPLARDVAVSGEQEAAPRQSNKARKPQVA